MLADHDEHVMKLWLWTWRSWNITHHHQITVHLRGVDIDTQSNEGNSHFSRRTAKKVSISKNPQ